MTLEELVAQYGELTDWIAQYKAFITIYKPSFAHPSHGCIPL